MREIKKRIRNSLLLSVLIGSAVFGSLFFSGKIQYGEAVEKYTDGNAVSGYAGQELELKGQEVLRQEIPVGKDNLESVSVKFHKDQFSDTLIYTVSLCDAGNDNVLDRWEVRGDDVNSEGYDIRQISEKQISGVEKMYLQLSANEDNKALCYTETDAIKGYALTINRAEQKGDIILRLTRRIYVTNTLYSAAVISWLVGLTIGLFFCFRAWNPLFSRIRRSCQCCCQAVRQNKRQYIRDFLALILIGAAGVGGEIALSRSDLLEYNTVDAFNEYRCIFMITFFLCGYIFVRFRDCIAKKPEYLVLLLFLLIGGMYVAVLPAGVEVSWDESIHYWNAVGMSHAVSGKANAAESWIYWQSGIGYGLPNSIEALRLSQSQVQTLYSAGQTVAANTGILTKIQGIAYVPSAIGLLIGRKLHFSQMLTFQLGAGMNMLLYVWLVFCSVKRLKSGKMILVATAGLATPMFLAAVYNYDSWITGFTMLGIATFLGCMQEEAEVSGKDMAIMLGSFTLGFLPKAVYFPLFLIYLLIPETKFKSYDEMRRFRVATLAFCVTLALEMVLSFKLFLIIFAGSYAVFYVGYTVWSRFSRKQKLVVMTGILAAGLAVVVLAAYFVLPGLLGRGDLRGGATVNSAEQMRYILENPIRYARILFSFLITKYLYFGASFQSVFKTFGYLGESSVQIVSFALLLFAAVTDKNESDQWKGYRRAGICTTGLSLLTIMLIATALYISYTPVGLQTINGCQPRYLIPLMFAFFALIGSNQWKHRIPAGLCNSVVIGGTTVLLFVDAWEIVVKFYY